VELSHHLWSAVTVQLKEVGTIADISTTVTRHVQEIDLIRGKVYALEQQHNQMKAK